MSDRRKELWILSTLAVLAVSLLLFSMPESETPWADFGTKLAFAILVALVVRLLAWALEGPSEDDGFQALGMRRVNRRLSDEELRDHLAEASQIRVVKTWFPETRVIAEGLERAICERSATVKLLLAHPDSEVLAVRSDGAGKARNYGGHSVTEALRQLCGWASSNQGARVEVHLYDSWPGSPVIWCNERAFLGFYLRGAPSPEWPWIEVSQGSELYDVLNKQFYELWGLRPDPGSPAEQRFESLDGAAKICSWVDERRRHSPGPTT